MAIIVVYDKLIKVTNYDELITVKHQTLGTNLISLIHLVCPLASTSGEVILLS